MMKKESYLLGLGAKKDKKDRRDYHIAGITPIGEIPVRRFIFDDLFDSKNQFSRGSCTSQAQAHHKERQEGVKSSARFVMALTKKLEGNNEYGAYNRNTFKVVNKNGICKELLMPEPDPTMSWEEYIDASKITDDSYNDAKNHKSQSYWRVETSIPLIKQVLYNKRVTICISMAWFSEFNSVGSGGWLPTKYKLSNYVGGHCVEIAGFDEDKQYIWCKNSWGKNWGAPGGFFKLPYSIFNKIVWDCWSSLDIPKNANVDIRYGISRTWASFMREKSMAFNPWLLKKLKRLPNNREINGLTYGFWDYESIFEGKYGDLWLRKTKPAAIKEGLI